MTKAHMIYNNNPDPYNRAAASHITLTIVESMSKYSAKPPQTPDIFLSSVDR